MFANIDIYVYIWQKAICLKHGLLIVISAAIKVCEFSLFIIMRYTYFGISIYSNKKGLSLRAKFPLTPERDS